MAAKQTTRGGSGTKKKAGKGGGEAAGGEVVASADLSADAGTRQHLPDIVRRLGAPTKEDRELFSLDASDVELVERGARIGSSKVLTDLSRWTGQVADYIELLTAEERRTIAANLTSVARLAAA